MKPHKQFLLLVLFLSIVSSVVAQEKRQLWNASVQNTIFLTPSDNKSGGLEAISWIRRDNKKEAKVRIVSQKPGQNFRFQQVGQPVCTASYLSPSELTVTSTSRGETYIDIWTLRGGASKYPVPSPQKANRTFWKNRAEDKGFQVLTGEDGISLTMVTSRNGRGTFRTKRARWLKYPYTFVVLDPIGEVRGQFVNGVMKIGATTFRQIRVK